MEKIENKLFWKVFSKMYSLRMFRSFSDNFSFIYQFFKIVSVTKWVFQIKFFQNCSIKWNEGESAWRSGFPYSISFFLNKHGLLPGLCKTFNQCWQTRQCLFSCCVFVCLWFPPLPPLFFSVLEGSKYPSFFRSAMCFKVPPAIQSVVVIQTTL